MRFTIIDLQLLTAISIYYNWLPSSWHTNWQSILKHWTSRYGYISKNWPLQDTRSDFLKDILLFPKLWRNENQLDEEEIEAIYNLDTFLILILLFSKSKFVKDSSSKLYLIFELVKTSWTFLSSFIATLKRKMFRRSS